jgi:exodeoxyribonuclease III
MKIASWNVNSLNVRLPHLTQWLADAQPDVVALQETKLEDAKFPVDALAAAGYRAVYAGQKTYNGVALLARADTQPAFADVVTDIPGLDDPQRRILAATVGDVRVVDLYVVNGKAVGDEKYAYKLDWMTRVREFLAGELERHPHRQRIGQPLGEMRQAHVERVDVPAGDLHRRIVRERRRGRCAAQASGTDRRTGTGSAGNGELQRTGDGDGADWPSSAA